MAYVHEYLFLKNKITSARCPPEVFLNLKQQFITQVNSKRYMEVICNLTDLVEVLEKRYFLNCDNILAFKTIATYLNRRDLVKLVDQYRLQHYNRPRTILPTMNRDLNQRVYDKIHIEIGRDWKEFARNLSISEGYIDQLDLENKSVSKKILVVLKHYETICLPSTVRSNICKALDQCRRKDLRHEVENIYDTHSLMQLCTF